MGDKDDFFAAAADDTSPAAAVQLVQPSKDPRSNWEVDLVKNLEEYLLKICSGSVTEDDHAMHSVNFAEAALLLQGSVQVYSRKVEYLHSLVLHALEFISEKKQDHSENSVTQSEGAVASTSRKGTVEEEDIFLGLDDVPVETKICLDDGSSKDDNPNQMVKTPANLLVLEGDSLENTGDASELECYLLATCNFYGDFLLLDPSDAGAVQDYLNMDGISKEKTALQRTNSVKSKSRQSVFYSPTGRSGGTATKAHCLHSNHANLDEIDKDCHVHFNNDNTWSEPHFERSTQEENMWDAAEQDFGCSHAVDESDDDDDDDPWKPLNPHEPGNLKIKPFKKGRSHGRQVLHNGKRSSLASQFPIAKLDRPICPEFAEIIEASVQGEKLRGCQSPTVYEKLRRSLVLGEYEAFGDSYGFEDNDTEHVGETCFSDYEPAEFDIDNDTNFMNMDAQLDHEKQNDETAHYDVSKACDLDNMDSCASLEELCRSHLDTLLATLAESEKQTELAARVSTWKQRIEYDLEEQDKHAPFDIQLYGERILDKLSLDKDGEGIMSFTDVIMGQQKHDVARTFSALLQLVNNGDVELQRSETSSKLTCHTAANPFHVKILQNNRKTGFNISSKKRMTKSPLKKGCRKTAASPSPTTSPQKSKNSMKLVGKPIRCTPEGKRRRQSTLVGSVEL